MPGRCDFPPVISPCCRTREELIEKLGNVGVTPAMKGNVIGEHVTYEYPSSNVTPEAQRIEVYGYARGESVDALLVRVDGEALRDNGTPFHITLSVAPGHKPVEAGALADRAISAGDYTRVEPFEIDAIRF